MGTAAHFAFLVCRSDTTTQRRLGIETPDLSRNFEALNLMDTKLTNCIKLITALKLAQNLE